MKEPEGMSFTSGTATVSGATDARDEGDAYSLIDAHSSLDGTLTTRRDLLVEGKVTGTVRCEGTLYIAEGASVDADVDASNIVVSGSMSGTIRCHGLLEIRDSGSVRGEVSTARLTILEGAVYEGHIRMQPGEPAPASATPAEPSVDTNNATESTSTPASSAASYSFLRSFTGSQPSEPATSDDLPGGDLPDDPEA
jgi:cytoskeletal protein CcmA (bactofilin family)